MYRLISISDENFTDRRWQRYFNFMANLHERYKSDHVAVSWQDLRSRHLSFLEKEKAYDRMVIFENDDPVGWMIFWILNYDLPGQMPLLEFNALYDTVPPALKRTMACWFIEMMKTLKMTKAFNVAVDQRLSEVAREWGGEQLSRFDKYVLRAAEADENVIDEWLRTIPEHNKDLRVQFYKEYPDEYLSPIADLLTETLGDMPEEHESDMPYHADPDEIRKQIQWRRENKVPLYSCLIFNEDDEIVALSSVEINLNNTKNIDQGMTGVARKYRKRGLAKWLKAALLKYLREQFPEIETFSTYMRAVNDPIQRVNMRLGFTREQQGYEFRITRENLEQYLKSCED